MGLRGREGGKRRKRRKNSRFGRIEHRITVLILREMVRLGQHAIREERVLSERESQSESLLDDILMGDRRRSCRSRASLWCSRRRIGSDWNGFADTRKCRALDVDEGRKRITIAVVQTGQLTNCVVVLQGVPPELDESESEMLRSPEREEREKLTLCRRGRSDSKKNFGGKKEKGAQAKIRIREGKKLTEEYREYQRAWPRVHRCIRRTLRRSVRGHRERWHCGGRTAGSKGWRTCARVNRARRGTGARDRRNSCEGSRGHEDDA